MNKIGNRIATLLSIFCVILSFMLAGCTKESYLEQSSITRNFKFDNGTEGWTAGFSDLPSDYDKSIYELEFRQGEVPVDGKKDKGLMIKGHNRSDDLFMYITRGFTESDGLKKNTEYSVKLSFDIATHVQEGLMGIGGSPGEAVHVKAGVTVREPKVENRNGMLEVNIDKGQQASEGKEALILGNIAKSNSKDDSYQYKHFEKSYKVTTNSRGEAWVIIGTESGFEGLTTLYYTNIQVVFEKK